MEPPVVEVRPETTPSGSCRRCAASLAPNGCPRCGRPVRPGSCPVCELLLTCVYHQGRPMRGVYVRGTRIAVLCPLVRRPVTTGGGRGNVVEAVNDEPTLTAAVEAGARHLLGFVAELRRAQLGGAHVQVPSDWPLRGRLADGRHQGALDGCACDFDVEAAAGIIRINGRAVQAIEAGRRVRVTARAFAALDALALEQARTTMLLALATALPERPTASGTRPRRAAPRLSPAAEAALTVRVRERRAPRADVAAFVVRTSEHHKARYGVETFRRAGVTFGVEPVLVDAASLTEDQRVELLNEPALDVEQLSAGQSARVDPPRLSTGSLPVNHVEEVSMSLSALDDLVERTAEYLRRYLPVAPHVEARALEVLFSECTWKTGDLTIRGSDPPATVSASWLSSRVREKVAGAIKEKQRKPRAH